MYNTFKIITTLCKEQGATYSEIRLTQLKCFELTFSQGKKEWNHTSDRIELYLALWIDESFGHSHTTSISDQSLNQVVENAFSSLRTSGSIEPQISQKPVLHKLNDMKSSRLLEEKEQDISDREKINFLKKIDSSIREISSRIETSFRYQDREGMLYLGNSNAQFVSYPISEFNLDLNMHYEYALKKLHRSFTLAGAINKTNFSPKLAAITGKTKAQRFLNSTLVTLPPKKRMPVIMDGNLTGAIFHELIHGLDGDFAVSGSPWRKKYKKRIFSKAISIHDIPNYSDPRLVKFYLDAEGLPSTETILVKDGVVTSYITDSNSAETLKVKNSGNARLSLNNQYLFPVTTNLKIQPGDASIHEMMTKAQQGVFCQGSLEVSVDWPNNTLKILPEHSLLFTNGELHKDLPLSVIITSPIKDFTTGLQKIGNKAVVSGIHCTKGGGIICGVVSPSMLFERFQVQER